MVAREKELFGKLAYAETAERGVLVLEGRTLPTGEVATWVAARNAAATTIDWRFTTENARIKLKRLYPAFHA